MALRLASRRAAVILNGSAGSLSAGSTLGAKICNRHAAAMAVPTPTPMVGVKEDIMVSLYSSPGDLELANIEIIEIEKSIPAKSRPSI